MTRQHAFAMAGAVRILVCAALWAPRLTAAQEAVERSEDWSGVGVGGWRPVAGVVSLTNCAGAATVGFAPQTAPMAASDIVRMPLEPGIRPCAVSFRFRAQTVPSALRVCLHAGASGRVWYAALRPRGGGAWQTFDVRVEHDAGWIAGPAAGRDAFEKDLLTVDWVGVYVRRPGDPAGRIFQLDDFRLQGWALDSDGDGMSDLWERGHGFDAADRSDGAADADGDGMSNRAECRAGSLPRDARSRLWVQVQRIESAREGARLRWPSVSNRTYAVWEATSPGGRFAPARTRIAAAPPENVLDLPPAAGSDPRFYRIAVE